MPHFGWIRDVSSTGLHVSLGGVVTTGAGEVWSTPPMEWVEWTVTGCALSSRVADEASEAQRNRPSSKNREGQVLGREEQQV